MKYQYNYSFLANWIKVNGKISYKEILKAIGTSSNNSLYSYEEKKAPMPIIGILRFCNTFNVPISAFITNTDIECDEIQILPNINDQMEPDGGYMDSDEKRTVGNRALRNPLDVVETPSIMPDYKCKTKEIETKRLNIMTDNIDQTDVGISEREKNSEERSKLISIIAEQQKTIAELQKQIVLLSQYVIKNKRYELKESEKSDILNEEYSL